MKQGKFAQMKKTFGHSFFWLALLAFAALFACACSGDDKQAGGATEETQIAIEDKTVAGVSEKGPFTVGSAVHIYELEFETLGHTGRSIPGKIASDRGDFRFTHLNLECQFAFMEVSGYYRNENTGKQSTAPITLNALVDLSDKETANINLLTHLAFERTLFLVNEGKPVKDAKQQAEQEILKAFYIENELIGDFEGLSIFKKGEGNAALLAISSLMQADLAEGDFSERLANFAYDIEKDGVWNDSVTATAVADWASAVSLSTYYSAIRSNIKGWKISDIIPDFEKSMDKFWWENYGLGDCDKEREGVVKANTNALSKLNGVYFICEGNLWRLASDIEKDTYKWKAGKDGDVKFGDVVKANCYVYEDKVWRAGDAGDCSLGLRGCTALRQDTVGQGSDDIWYICDNRNWRYATTYEKDTYKWKAGKDGDVKFGDVVKANCYVYEDKVWRAGEANDCSLGLRGCTVLRQDTVGQGSDKNWYKCVSQTWRTATDIEKDTATWGAGVGGEVRPGQVNKNIYYIYETGGNIWRNATTREKDLYGWEISKDGRVKKGNVSDTFYVYDDDVYRIANEREILVMQGCTAYNEDQIAKTDASDYVCKQHQWNVKKGQLVDSRDGQVYATVRIGKQVWMAQDLNYSDSAQTENLKGASWCWADRKGCSSRLYFWNAAMDVSSDYQTDVYGKSPIRGLCPEDWHIPSSEEWEELINTVGGYEESWLNLKSWGYEKDGRMPMDTYGFDATINEGGFLTTPGYGDCDVNSCWCTNKEGIYFDCTAGSFYWSFTEVNGNKASVMHIYYADDQIVHIMSAAKTSVYSVRCIKDEE